MRSATSAPVPPPQLAQAPASDAGASDDSGAWSGGYSLPDWAECEDDAYLDGEFVKTVQQRGAAIIQARNASSALSAASATCDHINSWVNGTPDGDWVSMAVPSDGSYGIEEGLLYSFPVTCKGGKWSIVQGLAIDELGTRKVEKAKF